MKKLLLFNITLLFTTFLLSQDTDLTDRVNIEQNNQKFMGVFSYAYQDVQPNGFSLFQLHNYGGIPGAPLATPGGKILGAFMFSGYDGSAKKQLAELRVSSLAGFTPTNTPVRMDFIVGPDRLKRMSILGDSGFVGVGTSVPTAEFDVDGNIRMRAGAVAGYIPVADADGVMTWTDPYNVIPQDPPLWMLAGSGIANTFGDVGIGTFNPSQRLDVDGNIRMRAGAVAGYIPVADADGVMTWTDPYNVIPQDPPLWLQTGSGISNVFGFVGINNFNPTADLHIGQSSNSASGSGGLLYDDLNFSSTWKTYHGGTHFSFAENGVRLAYVEGNGIGNFITVSDKRFKKNIKPIPSVLAKVMELNPVSYLYKHQTNEKSNLGFIAQDVQELFPEIVATSEDNSLGINYAASGVIAIKAIQEQQYVIDQQSDEIKRLEAELEAVKTQHSKQYEDMLLKFEKLEDAMGDCCIQSNDSPKKSGSNTFLELNGSNVPTLEQNTPNPFYEQTVIRYYIPSSAKSANMTITDIKGLPIKSVNIEGTGLGVVTINANELPVGTYIYTLFVDGRQIESKQMILVK